MVFTRLRQERSRHTFKKIGQLHVMIERKALQFLQKMIVNK